MNQPLGQTKIHPNIRKVRCIGLQSCVVFQSTGINFRSGYRITGQWTSVIFINRSPKWVRIASFQVFLVHFSSIFLRILSIDVRLVAGFPPRRSGFEPRSGNVGFVVNILVLGQVFSEYFGFPSQFSFHRMLNIHHHLSSGAGTIAS
jgi:hypothetical protein